MGRQDYGDLGQLVRRPSTPSQSTPQGAGEKNGKENKKEQKQKKRRFGFFKTSLLICCLFGALLYVDMLTGHGRKITEQIIMKVAAYAALKIYPDLLHGPELTEKIRSLKQKQVIQVIDANGEPMGVLGDEKCIMLTFDQIPDTLKKALVDQENSTFWTDHGVSLPSILASAISNARAGKHVRGASTLTQQLVKRILLTPEKNFVRKFKEAVLSWMLSYLMSKEELITLYVNIVPFDGTIGFAAAAQQYFGRDLNNLETDEHAILVQMLRGPSKFSPVKHPTAAAKGRDIVLNRMVAMSHLSPVDAEKLKAKPLTIKRNNALATSPGEAPECLYELKDELKEKYGETWMYIGGTVKSTCHLTIVRAMRDSMSKYLKQVNEENGDLPSPDAAAIVIDSMTGELIGKVIVGYTLGALDLTRTPRPFGSTAKPFYYAKAFGEGFTPATLMWDSQLPLPPAKPGAKWWSPNSHNPTEQPMRLRIGLAESKNTLASRLVYNLSTDNDLLLGTRNVISLMKTLGIDLEQMNTKRDKEGSIRQKFEPEYSLALGASNAGLTHLVSAYTAFDNEGQLVKIHSLSEVNGKRVDYQSPTKVIDPALAYLVRNVLKSTVEEGTGRFAKDRGIEWGKTGTTNSNTDALFIGGFTHGIKGQEKSRLTFGIWMGYRDGNRPMGSKYEGSQTLRMAVNFLPIKIRSDKPISTTLPHGVVVKFIHPTTGQCVEEGTPGAISEIFLERTLPMQCGGTTEPRQERLPPPPPSNAQFEGGGRVHATPGKPAGLVFTTPVPGSEPQNDMGIGAVDPTEQQEPSDTSLAKPSVPETQPEESGN